MKATITLAEGYKFIGTADSGHTVTMDGPPEIGGKNEGLRPMEMVLIGMGGCSATDVVLILRRGRQPIEGCVVELEAERAKTDPKVFTRIHAHYVVTGRDLNPGKVARAIELSAEKYCSASIMLAKTATITHDFEIRTSAQPATI